MSQEITLNPLAPRWRRELGDGQAQTLGGVPWDRNNSSALPEPPRDTLSASLTIPRICHPNTSLAPLGCPNPGLRPQSLNEAFDGRFHQLVEVLRSGRSQVSSHLGTNNRNPGVPPSFCAVFAEQRAGTGETT